MNSPIHQITKVQRKEKKEENETHKFKAKAATRTLFILHKKECCGRGFALIFIRDTPCKSKSK